MKLLHEVDWYGFASKKWTTVSDLTIFGGLVVATAGWLIGQMSRAWLTREQILEVNSKVEEEHLDESDSEQA